MARRRYFRATDRVPVGPRVNERIRISPVRLIDEDDEMIGVVDLDIAKARAIEAGLDLVEVAANSTPPVCRIMDFGKWKYEQSKKDRAQKAKSKATELKEVRLGRSMKIDPHDIEIRLQQARRFLLEGHKVQIVQNFRGREMAHRHRGSERMKQIIERMSDLSKLETPPRMAGRRMTMILAPDKTKIERYKRQLEAEKTQKSTPAVPADPVDPTAEQSTVESAASDPGTMSHDEVVVETESDSHPEPVPAEKN